MFQQSALEAFMHAGKIVAHDARQDADDGIKKRQRRRLTTGEDVIADRHFLQPARLDHPLVDAFETAADDDRAFSSRQFTHTVLRQGFATWAHKEAGPSVAIRNMVDGRRQNVGFQHHTGTTTCRCVIDASVFVGGEFANLYGVQRPLPSLERLACQRISEMPRKHFRVERQNGSLEGHDFISCRTAMRRFRPCRQDCRSGRRPSDR